MRKVNEKPRISAAISGGRRAMVRASPHVQASRGTLDRGARDDVARGIRAIPGSLAENAQEPGDDYLAGVRLDA